jgi:chorismate-pyruvate lyase
MRALKLAQSIERVAERCELLDAPAGEALLRRKVLLQGGRSRRTYLYAESTIALTRLDSGVREGLLHTPIPFGRLWRRFRGESYKEVLYAGYAPAGKVSAYLAVRPDAAVPARTCRLYFRGRPVMLLDEYFSPALANEFLCGGGLRRPA